MNIVPLAEVDGFIRTALTEVRKGVATARNNSQANPLNGIMVDLPEKIDFEMMVVTAYQTLLKSSSTTETVASEDRMSVAAEDIAGSGLSETSGDLELDVETSFKISGELETETSFSRESTQGLELDSSEEGELESTQGLEMDNSEGLELDSSKEANDEVGSSSEDGTSGQSSLESSGNLGSSLQTDGEIKKDQEEGSGLATESESRKSSGNGGGSDTYSASGTGTVTGSEASSEQKTGGGTKISNRSEQTKGTNRVDQGGQVFEQNARFSRTFDQSTGRWGTQAISTTDQPCRLVCS